MTLHRLHAGDGYTYLTRQVAACDHTLTRGQNIADYYTAEGAPPGRWAGRGAAVLGVEGTVSETQMKALFGEGMHPDAEARIADATAQGRDAERAVAAQQLGRPFPTFENKIPYLAAVKAATAAARTDAGAALPAAQRQRIRLDVAQQFFTAAHERAGTPKELTDFIRSQEAKVRQPVAGYDLVFTPQKSISALWGLGDKETKEAVERAHTEAVNETLAWIETEAGFTRRGTGSTEQVDTDGLVITQFVHFDNRTGDPNLHTHCAVSNKVSTAADGKWRSLDARPLHRIAVAAAARYNNLVADKTARYAAVAFEDRGRGDGKRPVREIVGMDQGLLDEFSRRDQIMDRARELTAQYRTEHGRTPSKAQQIRIVQQATLDTRSGKAPPTSLSTMRAQWRDRAETYLAEREPDTGTEPAHGNRVDALLAQVRSPAAQFDVVFDIDAAQWAATVIERVSTARSTWTEANVRTVVEDELSRIRFADPTQARRAVEQVTHAALHRDSLLLDITLDTLPAALTRTSGESVFTDHGAARFSSESVLGAEQRLLDAAHTQTVFTVSAEAFDGARRRREALETARMDSGEFVFNDGQVALAQHLATAETLVAVGIGPAGTGKTASMKLLVDTWHEQGRTVLALGPSAAAATVLGEDVGVPGKTIASILYCHRTGIDTGIERGTLILVDEAGMASTRDLDALVALAAEHGAVVRMIGDSAQLNAVDAGGALGMLARESRAPELVEVVRFRDPDEAAASLGLRTGDTDAIEFYAAHDRMIGGTDDELLVRLLDDHLADTRAGLSSVMLAPTNEQVRQLNTAAQAIHHTEKGTGNGASAALSDTARAHAGDVVVTRKNRAQLRAFDEHGRRYSVQNGDLWTVTEVRDDGALEVTGERHGAHAVLPAWYVAGHTELGYAHTIHRAQGLTVDVGRALLGASVDRQAAYVAMTRGKGGNYAYLAVDTLPEPDLDHAPDPQATPAEVFAGILARDGEERAAIEHLREGLARASDPHRFRTYYDTAAVKLGDAHARYLLDRALPAAVHTTAAAQRGWDGAVAAIRDHIARGGAPTDIIDILTDPSLHTARNVPVAILHRLENVETPEVASALPVLPPQHHGADTELRAFAGDMVAAIIDPHGPGALLPTDLDYTHPQQQAYRTAALAVHDASALTATREVLPDRVADTLTDRDWTELTRRVVDTAHAVDGAADRLELSLARFDTAEAQAVRTLAATLAVDTYDVDLVTYVDELRSYLDLPGDRTHADPETTPGDRPGSTAAAADRSPPTPTPVPVPVLDGRGARTDPVLPTRADAATRELAAAMSRDPVRLLAQRDLDAALADAARRRATLDQQMRLARAAKAAALGQRSVHAVRAEHAAVAAPATAAVAVEKARARKDQLDTRFAATVRDLDGAQQDLARAGRFAGAAKAEARERIAALTAEREQLNAARFAAADQVRRATQAAPPPAQRGALIEAATRSEATLDDRLAAAAERDRVIAERADATAARVERDRDNVVALGHRLHEESERRSGLDDPSTRIELQLRRPVETEPARGPRDGEIYRDAAHVAATQAQLERQRASERAAQEQRERSSRGSEREL